MKLELEITNESICAALRHAAPFWASAYHAAIDGGYVRTREEPRKLVPLNIKRGLEMMLERAGGFTEWGTKPQDWDRSACDCFIQYAAFGQILYS